MLSIDQKRTVQLLNSRNMRDYRDVFVLFQLPEKQHSTD